MEYGDEQYFYNIIIYRPAEASGIGESGGGGSLKQQKK